MDRLGFFIVLVALAISLFAIEGSWGKAVLSIWPAGLLRDKTPVSEEKLAKALNVDIKRIETKRTLLDGVCPEPAEMLKDKSVDTEVFSLLRKMKPLRQIEAVELMSAMNNGTARYAQALLAATRREDLAQPDRPKKIGGLSAEQMARMEREMDGLQRELKAVSASYGDTVLNLVVASGSYRA